MLTFVALAGLLGLSLSAPVSSNTTQLDTTGFLEPVLGTSEGGHAICVTGLVPVKVSTNHQFQLNISDSIDPLRVVQILLDENTQDNAALFKKVIGPFVNASGTFNISAQLCLPKEGYQNQGPRDIQILTHGVGFGRNYWDFAAPNNSYVDQAALAGRATFAYDRLGIGNSSHPDPIRVVQDAMQIETLHSLTQMLRVGALSDQKFNKVIGVGHSFGSALTYAIATHYPKDFDAVVLTGYSTNTSNSQQFTAALNLLPANNVSAFPQYADLPDGYLITSTAYGVQYSFLKYPNFAPAILKKAFETTGTMTLGEQFSGSIFAGIATNFTGPAYIVDGENDLSFCDGDCYKPHNIPEATLPMVFPNATKNSGTYILPNAGHGLNLHLNSNDAFQNIQQWIARVGF